jgi:ABC-type multidrug transport system ATPase subunit
MTPVVQVKGLTKRFGSKIAVNNIDFEVQQGQIFGLLGPNGSGKTTTLSSILTLLEPTSGDIHLFGSNDLSASLKRIGVLLESANYYPYLSAYQNLLITCQIKNANAERIDTVLEKVGLSGDKKRKVKGFSLGMKQRLSIASTLLTDPDLVIFDEPTNGLDPIGIAEMRAIIQEIAAAGKTVLIASHLLNEMEKVCTHIAILKNGQIVEHGELKPLMNGYATLEEFFLAKTR